jgi:AraC family transcriptional regulator
VEAAVGVRSTYVDDDVVVTSARLSGFVVNELLFPPSYAMRLDPEDGYVAVVVEGGFEKTFVRGAYSFGSGSAFTIPAGALHETRFGRLPSRVIVLRPAGDGPTGVPWERLLRSFGESRETPLGSAWRLAGELRAQDEAWPLAAEALCLDVVAAFIRADRPGSRADAPKRWLETVREHIHATLEHTSLGELALSAGVHPAHLARSFRERYGLSVGDYARRTRLDWAAGQLVATETPMAVLAAEAGFADQSHFTRAFKRHTGVTPGRYRRAARE